MMNLFGHTGNSLTHPQGSVGEFLLEKYFHSHSPLPAYSIFLGLCDDGIPLVWDLTDTNSGSFLIAGDDDASNYKVLSSLLTAAYCFNNSREINIHLISHHLEDFSRLLKTPHLNLCLKPSQTKTSIAIEELVNLGEQRRMEESLIPFHIVAIDGLDSVIQSADRHIRKLLTWLIEKGSEVGIYIVATIESSHITPNYSPILDCFPSRILNAVSIPGIARYLSGRRDPMLSDLTPGLNAVVFSGNKQNRIRIPQ